MREPLLEGRSAPRHSSAGSDLGGAVAAGSRLSHEALADAVVAVTDEVGRAVAGHDHAIAMALTTLFCGGHLLIEDLPGVGKTTLARALARALALDVRRVQGTPDLLPADVTGLSVPGTVDGYQAVFRPGPVFTNLLVMDELNRTTARTQSALLEAMEEGRVTVDGVTHALPTPFMVVATQNPHDSAGTVRLPHSLRDRFLCCVSLGYPTRSVEDSLIGALGRLVDPEQLRPVCGPEVVAGFAELVASTNLSSPVRGYVLDLVDATRSHAEISVGASPRAAIGLTLVAAARAALEGRDYVMPDDVKRVAIPVLAHRLVLSPAAEASGSTTSDLLVKLLAELPVPIGRQ